MSSDSSPKLLWNRAGGNQWDGSAQLRGFERVCVVHAVAGFVACLPFAQLACLVARCWSVNLCMGVWACRGVQPHKSWPGSIKWILTAFWRLESPSHPCLSVACGWFPSAPVARAWRWSLGLAHRSRRPFHHPKQSRPWHAHTPQTARSKKKVTAVSLGPPSCPSISEPSVSLLFFSLLRIRVPCVSGFPSVAIDFVFRLRAVLWQRVSVVLPFC